MNNRRERCRSGHRYAPYRGRRPGGRALRVTAAVLLLLTALAAGLLLGRNF